jgi:lipopolysaccharide export system ATP-binding protein
MRVDGQTVLRIEDISKRLGGRTVVDGASLEVRPGEVVGLLGPNGAGKTTIFRLLMGVLRPDGGRIRLGAMDLTGTPTHWRARLGMGYLPQEPSIFSGMTVSENLRAVLELRKPSSGPQPDELLDRFGLLARKDQRAASLSGGERRRLELARLLVTDPTFVLLDEPLKGLDPASAAVLEAAIAGLARRGKGILLTDHAVSRALALCKRTYILADGQILAAGPPAEVVRHPAAQRSFFIDEKTNEKRPITCGGGHGT